MAEFRIFGPPGTGKTTTISKNLQSAAERYGADKVMVASFTRAAAAEVAGRNSNIKNIGTLHSHGYRLLGGRQKIAENCIDAWNEEHPHDKLSGGKNVDVDETSERGACATDADELLSEMNLYRSLMTPPEHWRIAVRGFARRWEDWKHENDLIDYTDMIEKPYRDIQFPGAYDVAFFDEAQDFTPLELALVRKWGEKLQYIVLAGDDDQCIYSWNGARPDVLIDGTPDKKIVLSQSYRVPAAIHELSQELIQKVRKREPKEYLPRCEAGEVRRLENVNSEMPERIIEDMGQYLKKGKRVMVLATCSYMLNGVIKTLRREGIPFHNPYRVKAGNFNPLRRGGEGVPSYIRLLNFYRHVPTDYDFEDDDFMPLVNGMDVASWYELIRAAENIPRGQKDEFLQIMKTEETLPAWAIGQAFSRKSGIHRFFGKDDDKIGACRWFLENVTAAKRGALEYPFSILKNSGAEALEREPQVIVGTIHSVKGGEADVVYVIPDMSYAGYQEKTATLDGRDAALRLQYVAYTRAKESLILLGGATSMVM